MVRDPCLIFGMHNSLSIGSHISKHAPGYGPRVGLKAIIWDDIDIKSFGLIF